MIFYSKITKDADKDWSLYVENIYYKTDKNRLYYISMLDGRCRLCYNDFLNYHKVPEISLETVLEYLKYQLDSLQSEYFKEMARVNNLDDTLTIKRLKKIYNRLSK